MTITDDQIEAIAQAAVAERRDIIEQIIHECPKLQGEPSRDCIAALSGVATHAARQAARAVRDATRLADTPASAGG